MTDSWANTHGTLVVYRRDSGSRWQKRFAEQPVLLGRAGLAWGRGVVSHPYLPGPIKHEGDDKAPAGVFRLGPVFGYAVHGPGGKMPYRALTQRVVAVDDPKSRYYNQLVDRSKIEQVDWGTAEKMILTDQRYKWGIFVQHNIPPQPGAGSCIFLHVWKDPATLTSGCTAMAEEKLVRIIRWLDPARQPLLVQLPRPTYEQVRVKWDLP